MSAIIEITESKDKICNARIFIFSDGRCNNQIAYLSLNNVRVEDKREK